MQAGREPSVPAAAAAAAGRPVVLVPGDALLVVDLQNDFMPGGALGIAGGGRILPPVNRCIDLFVHLGLPVFASRDWHPPNHCSFREQGGPWPTHCVAGSAGAAFTDGLHLPGCAFIVSKATQREHEVYSAFGGTDLERRLRGNGIRRIFIAGLATDYCVVTTVRDARAARFEVVVLQDAIAAVDAQPGDGARAIGQMRGLGARFVDSADLVEPALQPH